MGQGNGIADLGWTRGSGQDARVREQAKDPPDVSWRSGRVQAVSAHRGHRMGLLAQRRAVCGSRPACPGSASGLPGVRPANGPWSGYQRWVRSGGEVWRIWVCRAKCRPCGVTHALLPSFALLRRLDAVEVVGAALERAAGGAGLRVVAAGLGVPHTPVRDWWRRFRVRAPVLVAGLCWMVVELGGVVAAVDVVGEHAWVPWERWLLGSGGGWAPRRRRAGRWRRWSAAGVAERHHEPALGRAGRAGLDAARAPTPALKEVAVPAIRPSGSDDPAEAAALRAERPARSAAHIASILYHRHGILVSERTVRAHLRRKGLHRAALQAQPT